MTRATTRILNELTGVKGELTGVKGELTGVKGELTGVKGELTGLRSEVTGLRTEFGEFRSEVRADIRHLSERVDGVNTRLDTVIDAVATLRTDFDRHTHD